MTGNILGNVVGFLLMLGVPLAVCIYYLWKRDDRIWMFLAGILSFTVSQLLLRIPLLQFAGKKLEWLMLLPYTSLVLYYGFLGVTAGVFEETGRWAAFRLMRRRRQNLDWKDALALGLGHGGVEAVWVALSGLMAGSLGFTAHGSRALLGGVERLFAMTLHVGFSFLIFKEIKEKKARWWLLAVILHGIADFQMIIGNVAVVEGLLAAEAAGTLLLLGRFIRKEKKTFCGKTDDRTGKDIIRGEKSEK